MLAMTRAATPYVTWLNDGSEQAGQTAAQARAAASAFETAQAAIVHPVEVAANRSGLVIAGGSQPARPEHPGDRGRRG